MAGCLLIWRCKAGRLSVSALAFLMNPALRERNKMLGTNGLDAPVANIIEVDVQYVQAWFFNTAFAE